MRPPRDKRMMNIAKAMADGSTCVRRKVGCVLTDKRGYILSTGCNGMASGLPHCNEGHLCEGAAAESGTSLDLCQAVHAEINALMQCRDIWAIDTCYVTASPCIHCINPLLNTSTGRIVFLDEYAHTRPRELWVAAGREWVQL